MKRPLVTTALTSALLLTCIGVASAQAPYLGEMRLFGFNFCPKNWLPANGQLQLINGNQALFSLFGTSYGGDGRTNFALPNLIGRAPVGYGSPPAGQPIGTPYDLSAIGSTGTQSRVLALTWCVAVVGIFPSRN